MFGIGHVAEDIQENQFWVKVFPIEVMTGGTGDMDAPTSKSIDAESSSGEFKSIVLDKGRTINCKWIPIGASNRVTPPNVCKGEMVMIYNYAGTDQYYWTTMDNEMDLRKNEKATWFFSNKKGIEAPNLKKAYHFTVDCINKFVRLFTSSNDGELTTYDFLVNTKKGFIDIKDGKNNFIRLDSEPDTLTITTNKKVNIRAADEINIENANTINVKANTTINVECPSGIINVKGGTVNIN